MFMMIVSTAKNYSLHRRRVGSRDETLPPSGGRITVRSWFARSWMEDC